MADSLPESRRTIVQLDPSRPASDGSVPSARDAEGLIWVDLHAPEDQDREWLVEAAGLDRDVVDMLTEIDTRPRAETREEGTLLILRGVNPNPEWDPDDMVAIRIWMEAHRVFTVTSRDRAGILQDQILAHMSTSMNRFMVLLSLVAVVFLPLTFLTGLLGINVNGIPFAEHPHAFAGVCMILAASAAILILLVRRRSWP